MINIYNFNLSVKKGKHEWGGLIWKGGVCEYLWRRMPQDRKPCYREAFQILWRKEERRLGGGGQPLSL
jgi:hypothetical protein